MNLCSECKNEFEPDELFEDEQLCIECLQESIIHESMTCDEETYSYQEND